ncbi:MAG: hypothetical protein Fur0018_00280 [Anaerolineales bacterium]
MSTISPRDADYFHALQTRTGWGHTLEKFAAWVNPQPGCRALDVGCGPGLLPRILQEQACHAFGVDLDPQSFRPPRLHSALAAADACRLPFPNAAFDLITATNLLFLLPAPEQALTEIARLLRPGGRLALLNPTPALTATAAARFADQKGLTGLARTSLLQWAQRAEHRAPWTPETYPALLERFGVQWERSHTTIGPGFAVWVCARRLPPE